MQKVRISLTQPVWFSLEELAPVSESLSKLGKNTLLFGSYEKGAKGTTLRLGERTVDGDTVVFKERAFRI
ncbi:Uncharacterised protein [uncultured archaeon]|nr:Uncharacterised protein [uncultured archaeon]